MVVNFGFDPFVFLTSLGGFATIYIQMIVTESFEKKE